MLQRLFWIGILLSLLIYGLRPTTPTSLAQDEPRTIRVAINNTEQLDPTTLSRFDTNSRDIVENLFVGLTRLDADSGEIVPALASEWTVSPDGLVWIFSLRDDIFWTTYQSGEVRTLRPVVADDVVFGIQRACDPTRPSPKTTNIYIIEGCREIANLLDTWRINDDLLSQEIGVRAIDDTTLQIQLALPTPASYFLTMTSLPEFRPLPRELVIGAAPWPSVATLTTSGAWAVESWTIEGMTLIENPNWPLEKGNIERVEILFNVPADNVPLRLSSGTLDASRIRPTDADTLALALDTVIQQQAGGTVYSVGFSFEYPPFDNPLVRQALAYAIDRDGLINQLAANSFTTYTTANLLTPPSVIASPITDGVTFDPATAQTLLDNAGAAGCAGFPSTLTLVVHNDPLEIAIGQYIADQWNQNLGCPPIFQVGTASRRAIVDASHGLIDRSEDENAGRFALWLISWTADYPDANAWSNEALHCQFGFFRTGRACSSVDSLLDQGASALTIDERSAFYTQAELGLFGASGEFPVIPVIQREILVAHQSWLLGVAQFGPMQFDQWSIATP